MRGNGIHFSPGAAGMSSHQVGGCQGSEWPTLAVARVGDSIVETLRILDFSDKWRIVLAYTAVRLQGE